MATNIELIQEALDLKMAITGEEFHWNTENLKTFAEWKKCGYSVKKGEKAFLAVQLWKPVEKKVKDENGKLTGETETRFILKLCHLFTDNQVQVSKNAEWLDDMKPAKRKPAKRKYNKKKTA